MNSIHWLVWWGSSRSGCFWFLFTTTDEEGCNDNCCDNKDSYTKNDWNNSSLFLGRLRWGVGDGGVNGVGEGGSFHGRSVLVSHS